MPPIPRSDGRSTRWGTYVDRFYAGFEKLGDADCWIWQGSVDSSGYGQVKHRGRILKTHRVSYELYVGPIPDGLCVLHNCPSGDNPSCVNPNHLWLGTKLDNTRDMIAKGRDNFKCGPGTSNPGEKNGMAVLTEELVRWIRRVYIPRHPEFGQSALARRLNIGQPQIGRIINRECWNHVD